MNAQMLLAQLRRLRRRSLLVRAATYGCAAAIVLAGVTPALFVVTGSSTFVARLALASLAGAILAASLRTPSLRAAAAAADRALGLDDRVITALQHVADTDVFSALVVRDAGRRLRQAHPAAVFPFALPRHTRTLAIAAAVAAVAGLTLVPESFRAPASIQRTGGAADSDAGPATAGDRAVSRDASSAASSAQRPPAERVAVPVREAKRGESRTSAEPNASGAADRAAAPRQERLAADPSAAPDVAAGATSGASTAPVSAGARQDAMNARGSGAAATPDTQLAGGVSASAAATAAEAAVAAGRSRSGPLRGAADRAEAAMARDDIPPALRAYVRAYFEAIRR